MTDDLGADAYGVPAGKHVLLLPGGREIRVPEGSTPEQAWWRHAGTAVSEGLCPRHLTPLKPVTARPGTGVAAAGHCAACYGFWSLDTEQKVSWDIDHDPHGGWPSTPGWAAGQGTPRL